MASFQLTQAAGWSLAWAKPGSRKWSQRPAPRCRLPPVGHAIAGDRMTGVAKEGLILPAGDLVAASGERAIDVNGQLWSLIILATRFIGEPIVKVPAATTTISGHSSQSRRAFPAAELHPAWRQQAEGLTASRQKMKLQIARVRSDMLFSTAIGVSLPTIGQPNQVCILQSRFELCPNVEMQAVRRRSGASSQVAKATERLGPAGLSPPHAAGAFPVGKPPSLRASGFWCAASSGRD